MRPETDMDQQPVTETPVVSPPPVVSSTRQHMEREEAALRGPAETVDAPAVTEPPAPTDTPEAEAASAKADADLSEAARVLRRNRADERKAKIQREIDEAVREREQTRADIARLRQEREQLTRGEQPRSPATAGAAPAGFDPRDPAPDPTDTTRYPDGQFDVAFIRDSAVHAARQEWRQQDAQSRLSRQRQAYEAQLSTKVATARDKYADFDAVLEPLVAAVTGDPRDADISAFVAASPRGEDVLYRLAKDDTARAAVLTASSHVALIRELTRLEHEIEAPKSAPKPITAAPTPPSQTVGSGLTSSIARTPKTTREHYEREQAEIDARRRQGFR